MSIANVLLVDDEVSSVEAFGERLALRNLEISEAFSGKEALQTLEENKHVEVVILDVKMPGKDGIETLAQIKKNSRWWRSSCLPGRQRSKPPLRV